ncbi:MAG: thioredoxin family protein [Pseudomonadota bacterium]
MALNDISICDFGWKAPDFMLADASGVSHSMANHLGNKGLLIAFICNHCPYVKAIAQRFKTDTDELMAAGVGVLAIMSNDYQTYAEDAPKRMLEYAKVYGWQFPYLVDEDQSVARGYDAKCTPDFFGLNKDGELQYRGRLDDVRMGSADNGRSRDLVDAMMQIAETGQGPREQIPSMGCSIKWR